MPNSSGANRAITIFRSGAHRATVLSNSSGALVVTDGAHATNGGANRWEYSSILNINKIQ